MEKEGSSDCRGEKSGKLLPAASFFSLKWSTKVSWRMLTCCFVSFSLQMSTWPAYISQRLTHILQSWLTSRPSIWAWTRMDPLSQTTTGIKAGLFTAVFRPDSNEWLLIRPLQSLLTSWSFESGAVEEGNIENMHKDKGCGANAS